MTFVNVFAHPPRIPPQGAGNLPQVIEYQKAALYWIKTAIRHFKLGYHLIANLKLMLSSICE
jgi:hypothetical protein